jgi:hypothetical protein
MNTALPGAAKIVNGGFRLDVATTPSLSISARDWGNVPLLGTVLMTSSRKTLVFKR